MANIKGSARNDSLYGTALADRIQGLGGNDQLFGLGGNDTLEGGGGDDLLVGGAGSDTIDGGLGTDTVDYSGSAGAIRVEHTGYATDTNGVGNVYEYDAGGALLSTDQFKYVENFIGTAFIDLIYGGGGQNSIWGGAGDDRINGAGGNDRLFGGEGDDLIDVGNGNDHVDGGPGSDTLFWDWSGLLHPVVDLAAGRIDYPAYGSDNWDIILNFENVRGRDGNKSIFGTDGVNIVQGSAGSDFIDGRGGDDVLAGDLGRAPQGIYTSSFGFDDTILGGAGNDLISGDLGSDVLTGGSGSDTFVVDTYYGTDRITDFEDGIDTLALYGGLEILGWEARDSDGDGVDDAQAALLNNGQAIIFDGYSAPPPSLAGAGLSRHAEVFAIPELTTWSMSSGWGGDGF